MTAESRLAGVVGTGCMFWECWRHLVEQHYCQWGMREAIGNSGVGVLGMWVLAMS